MDGLPAGGPGAVSFVSGVPILLYHSISAGPGRYTVPPSEFTRQLDAVSEAGLTAVTVTETAAELKEPSTEQQRQVCITFDDGYADFLTVALPLLEERGLRATLYVTTTMLDHRPDVARLSWDALREVAEHGVEIGSHGRHHMQLDTLPLDDVMDETSGSKAELEDHLSHPINTFAYPFGYSSPSVRESVRAAGYSSACSVKNGISSSVDDVFTLPRLMLERSTGSGVFAAWLRGGGAAVSPRDDGVRARAWRIARRTRAAVTGGRGRAEA